MYIKIGWRHLAINYTTNDHRRKAAYFYDTIRYTIILTCAQKQTSSQLSLPHGTACKLKNK